MNRYVLIFSLVANIVFAQDIEIEIPSDRVDLLSGNNNFCYMVKNNSNQYYKVLIDSTGFSTGENEIVDEPYLGLMTFRIFDNVRLLSPIPGSYPYQKNSDDIKPSDKELMKFRKLNKIKSKNISELNLLYKINKRFINIPPKENLKLCTNISFPIYNSSADNGSLLYDVKSRKEYYLQLHLNIPREMLSKFSKILDKSSNNYKVFSGNIYSNKVKIILNDDDSQ